MWFRYEWRVSEWSDCSKPCDRGKQNRTAECKGVLGKMLVNSSLCTADKPENEQICNDDSCPAKWVTGNWSEVGDYVCYIVNNYERCCLRCSVSDNFFFGKLHCIENCPRGYVFWCLNRLTVHSSTKWFDFCFGPKCSRTCGRSYQSRSVECRDILGALSLNCPRETKEGVIRRCRKEPCAGEGEYSGCMSRILEELEHL